MSVGPYSYAAVWTGDLEVADCPLPGVVGSRGV